MRLPREYLALFELPQKINDFSRSLCLVSSSFNPLRPNNDLSQTSHSNIKGLSVSEVMRIENVINQVKFY